LVSPSNARGRITVTSWLTTHFDGPTLVVFLGALISAAGAFWFSSERIRGQRELRLLNEEIAAKSDKIAELSEQIRGEVTGGDSFAYVSARADSGADRVILTVIHQGKYPLYDLAARVVELTTQGKGGSATRHPIGSARLYPIMPHRSPEYALAVLMSETSTSFSLHETGAGIRRSGFAELTIVGTGRQR
jgi:hypothetical protein